MIAAMVRRSVRTALGLGMLGVAACTSSHQGLAPLDAPFTMLALRVPGPGVQALKVDVVGGGHHYSASAVPGKYVAIRVLGACRPISLCAEHLRPGRRASS